MSSTGKLEKKSREKSARERETCAVRLGSKTTDLLSRLRETQHLFARRDHRQTYYLLEHGRAKKSVFSLHRRRFRRTAD